MMYRKNLPAFERIIRILAGIGAIAYGVLWAPSMLHLALAIGAGIILLGTSLFGFCPACAMVGRRSIEP